MRRTTLTLGLLLTLSVLACTDRHGDDESKAPDAGAPGAGGAGGRGAVAGRPGTGNNPTGSGGISGGSGTGSTSAGAGGGSGGLPASSGVSGSEDASVEDGDLDAGVVEAEPPLANDHWYETNPFVLAERDAFSTFAVDVDTASYDLFRRDLNSGLLTSPASVRLEDFVNYFHYDYEAPDADAEVPFSIALAATHGATDRNTALLRVGIQAKQPPPFEKKQANLVFLVDVSGSMREEIPLVQRLLTDALDVLAADDLVSIVSYAGDTQVRLTPTRASVRSEITDAIEGLVSAGGTNGAAGIELAYAQAKDGFIEGGINHVVLCTDGDFNLGVSSDEALVELIEAKRETGVTLTALGFGNDHINDSMMEKVSNAGNGIYSVIASETQAARYAEERLLSTLVHVAKDVKIQVEVNPERVLAYRLLGYENRAIADVDFRDDVVDAGEIGAGHRVTALYELVLQDGELPEVDGAPAPEKASGEELPREVAASDLVLVKVRYKQPGATAQDAAQEVSASLAPDALHDSAEDADDDLRFAAAVAALAEALKHSPYATEARLEAAQAVFDAQSDRDADRKELADLSRRARALMR